MEEVDGELLLVMDYIEGGSLSQLIARGGELPMGVALRVLIDVCAGIDAIHTAKDEQGIPLGLVHRDVSPQNVLVGFDGVARVTDFGIAKSAASPKRTAKNVRRQRRPALGARSPLHPGPVSALRVASLARRVLRPDGADAIPRPRVALVSLCAGYSCANRSRGRGLAPSLHQPRPLEAATSHSRRS